MKPIPPTSRQGHPNFVASEKVVSVFWKEAVIKLTTAFISLPPDSLVWHEKNIEGQMTALKTVQSLFLEAMETDGLVL